MFHACRAPTSCRPLSCSTPQNFVRPLRFSLAIALAPFFERLIGWVSTKTGLAKPKAFILYLICFALLTMTLLGGGLYVCGGFPAQPVA